MAYKHIRTTLSIVMQDQVNVSWSIEYQEEVGLVYK